MPRFVQTGNSLDYTPVSDVAAGAVVKIGNNFFGIAPRAILAGALGALGVTGVYAFAKATGTIAAGTVLFWDADNEIVTGTPVANGYIGRAVAASSGATVDVLLNGTNLGAMDMPDPQAEPVPSAADVTPTVTDAPTATNAADVTATGTYADDDDAIEAAINANRADIAAILTWVGAAKTDIGALATNLNKINDDIAAIVAKLKTAGIFE